MCRYRLLQETREQPVPLSQFPQKRCVIAPLVSRTNHAEIRRIAAPAKCCAARFPKMRRAEEPAQSASTAAARAAEAAVQDTGTGRRTTREGCSRSRTVLRRRAAWCAQGWMKATGRWVRG